MLYHNQESFEELRKRAKIFYDAVRTAYCPALKDEVHFTSDGFHHLRYDNTRAERSKLEQKNKLGYLKESVEVIESTATIKEYRKSLMSVGKVGRDGFRKTKTVEYYGFWAITDIAKRLRFKVIVRRIGDGPFHFWSLMPEWIQVQLNQTQSARFIGSRQIEDI